MADGHIDHDETRIYGDYAVEQIAHHLVGRVRELDPALHLVTTALRAASDAVAAHLRAARASDADLNAALASREAPLAEARDVLTRFSRHLESHRGGVVPYGAFFVEASATLARRGPQRLLAALDHVLGSLDEFSGQVREAGYWHDEIARARASLEGAVDAERLMRATPVRSPALDQAMSHWHAVYAAAKHMVSAALLLSGSSLTLDEVFDDLAEVHRAEGAIDDAAPAEETPAVHDAAAPVVEADPNTP